MVSKTWNFGVYLTIIAAIQVAGEPPNKIPPNTLYFGWFFSEPIADSLQQITNGYLKQAFEQIPDVNTFLRALTPSEQNPLDFFVKPLDPATGEKDPLYHVTAQFCGGNRNCSFYYDFIRTEIDKEFDMSLIGVFFTKDTFGIRVALTQDQEDMFDVISQTALSKIELKNEVPKDYPGIEFIPQDRNFTPSTSKAHVTLGCGPGIQAVQTGPDLLSVVKYETSPQDFQHVDYELENVGILRRYADMQHNQSLAFVFYLDSEMKTKATFKGYITNSGVKSFQFQTKIWIVIFSLIVGYKFK